MQPLAFANHHRDGVAKDANGKWVCTEPCKGKWWSIANGDEPKFQASYGAAWNFDTFAEAEEAALKECRRHSSLCSIDQSSYIQCLVVVQYHPSRHYNTLLNRMGKEQFAMKTAADVHREFERFRRPRQKRGRRVELEMYHCPATGETWTR